MFSLMDSKDGAYRVVTGASRYVIGLDRMVVRREPRTENPDGSLLRRDDELITLLGILDCTVGRPMQLHIDLHVLRVPFTLRCSTAVVCIERGERTKR